MYVDSEQMLDSVFLSYDKTLKKLHLSRLTTKQGKEITELDLRKAIDVMLENIRLVDGEVKNKKQKIFYFDRRILLVIKCIFPKRKLIN